MLLGFVELKTRYGSPYQIDKAIREGLCFKLEAGIYSDTGEEDELDIIQFKYPKAILTLESAFFYQNLTDTVPEFYCLATGMHSAKISDARVRQCYVADDIAGVVVDESGFELCNVQGGNIMKVCLIGGNDTQYTFE